MRNFFAVGILALILFAGTFEPVVAQELTLYSMPSPREIDWSSPMSLARGSLLNRLTFHHVKHKHAIGHVFIELRDKNGAVFTGSVPAKENSSQRWVLKEGYGLGILFAPIEGALDSSEGLQAELVDRYQSGRIGFIRFLLNQQTYDRLQTYFKDYQARGFNKIYNGLNRPREGLGAGCSAFGISFLEVAGLMHPVWKKLWPIEVRIPTKLIGGPITRQKVPLTKVLSVFRWARPDEPHQVLTLYEPYKIWDWIVKTWNQEKAQPTHKVGLMLRGKAKGLVYDCRHLPCPTEPIFQGAALTK